MMLNDNKARIDFYQTSILQCQEFLDHIPVDDPHRDIKIEVMKDRIKVYKAELFRIKRDMKK